jgi:hypothetical protein
MKTGDEVKIQAYLEQEHPVEKDQALLDLVDEF